MHFGSGGKLYGDHGRERSSAAGSEFTETAHANHTQLGINGKENLICICWPPTETESPCTQELLSKNANPQHSAEPNSGPSFWNVRLSTKTPILSVPCSLPSEEAAPTHPRVALTQDSLPNPPGTCSAAGAENSQETVYHLIRQPIPSYNRSGR